MTAKKQTIPKKHTASLAEFMLNKKRAGCPVCALPIEVYAEIVEAKKRKFKRSDVLEWLATTKHVKLTVTDLDRHYSGRHEQ